MPPKAKWKTIEEYRAHKNALAREKRDIQRARGECAYNGCKVKTPNHYCKHHAVKKNLINRKKYSDTKVKLEEYERALSLLSCFSGQTLIERAAAARKYYESR